MEEYKKVVLTGDRPTGQLHLGHFVGSMKNRVLMQEKHDTCFYMVADLQALTDNADNPEKIRSNVREVVLDNMAVGLDPEKTTMFVQSLVPEIALLNQLFMNFVTVNQLRHNPTIKTEIKQKGYEESIPLGFLAYPVSQAADILFCKGNVVPVGEDQMPVIEQANEIVRKFNAMYSEVFSEIEGVVGEKGRLVGTDGSAKASKSLGNAIMLADSMDTIREKVMGMYTDPDHIHVEQSGKVEGNVVFVYLDIFDEDKEEVDRLKEEYMKGGLGDVVLKKRLIDVLDGVLLPIREERERLAKDMDYIDEVLKRGTEKAKEVALETMGEVRKAMGINYFI